MSQAIQQLDQSNHYFKNADISIYNRDVLQMNSIPKESIDLIVTSPPYNLGIPYKSTNDNIPYEEYLKFTRLWLRRCYDLTKNSGRLCLNIPLDSGRKKKIPLPADTIKIAQSVGWKYRFTILWNKNHISRRTAWGSWMSATAPNVTNAAEVIFVLYKGDWKRDRNGKTNDITRKEFIDWTTGIWTFCGQNRKGAGGHPAPFPVELPRRCIKLFSFVGDVVLDPFLGSGSTLIAAQATQRKAVGVDIDKSYCDIAVNRLQELIAN